MQGSPLGRPMDANPVTRLRKKELMALASPGKTPSSERQRSCRQRPGEDFKIRLRAQTKLFFEMFDFRGKRVRLYAQCAVSARKKTSETRTAVKLELINACTPNPGATSLGSMEGRAHSPSTLAWSLPPSPHPPPPNPQRATRDRAWHRVARVAPRFRHHHPVLRRHIDGEWSLLAWPWGFAFRHSLEDLHAQLVRVTRTITT